MRDTDGNCPFQTDTTLSTMLVQWRADAHVILFLPGTNQPIIPPRFSSLFLFSDAHESFQAPRNKLVSDSDSPAEKKKDPSISRGERVCGPATKNFNPRAKLSPSAEPLFLAGAPLLPGASHPYQPYPWR